MKRPRSQTSKDKTIETFGRRARLLVEAERYRDALVNIVEVYDMRSELFTSDAECAVSLYDRARLALKANDPLAQLEDDATFGEIVEEIQAKRGEKSEPV